MSIFMVKTLFHSIFFRVMGKARLSALKVVVPMEL